MIPALRTWVGTLDLRVLVLLHAVRFVGFFFLALQRRADLPVLLVSHVILFAPLWPRRATAIGRPRRVHT